MVTSIKAIAQEMDPARPVLSIRALARRHRWLTRTLPHPLSVRSFTDRHKGPQSTKHRFLSYNTYLMDVELDIDILDIDIGELTIVRKPAVNARASEIGQMLVADPYHIVALCEVWTETVRNRILAEVKASDRIVRPFFRTSESDSSSFLSDGLLVIGFDRVTISEHFHTFKEKGNRIQDADAWAEKGVRLTQIKVGMGIIDLYTTHLHSGGDLVDDPDESEKLSVRNAQLIEVLQFFQDTHIPDHVAILTGDFNINGHDLAASRYLRYSMALLNMYDLWPIHDQIHRDPPPSDSTIYSGEHKSDTTARLDFIGLCSPDRDTRFCSDRVIPFNSGERIDYIFVEQPRPEHAFTLDFSRVRRRPFPRSRITENQYYLSDHLGLDVKLIASPSTGL